MVIILSNDLKFARESCTDREGKLVRRCNKKSAAFTHFLTKEFTPLSTSCGAQPELSGVNFVSLQCLCVIKSAMDEYVNLICNIRYNEHNLMLSSPDLFVRVRHGHGQVLWDLPFFTGFLHRISSDGWLHVPQNRVH